MPKLMIRFLAISCICVFFYSCKAYQIPGIIKNENVETTINNYYFSNLDTDYVYKAHIEVYGNDLSGIVVVKKINDSIHRVVLTTDFGNKLFDFEIAENSFKVNYILDNLNRKIIINTLHKDFSLLLKKVFFSNQTLISNENTIFKSNFNNRDCYIYQSLKDNTLLKLSCTSKTKEKLAISFIPKNATFAESILITHYDIKLKIELNQIIN